MSRLAQGADMEVVRVLNNNAVLAHDRAGVQAILLGRGIGFGKHLGDSIAPGAVSERFVPDSGIPIGQLTLLLAETPMELVLLSSALADLAKEQAHIEPRPALILALADHLRFAVDRARQGVSFAYPLQWEVAQLYPAEYALGVQSLARINTALDVTLPQSEATAIAMHLVNAQFATGDMSATERMTTRIAQVLDMVGSSLGVQLDQESLEVARFVTHLRYLFTRLERGIQIESSFSGLGDSIRAEAPSSFQAAVHVHSLLAMDGRQLSRDEVAYLALHIARLSGETNRPRP